MKKNIYTCILFVATILAFFVGMFVANGNLNKDNLVGVYQTDSWNGKLGTLVLYEDGTCQYPSGGNATWQSDGNAIRITLESSYSIQDGSTKGMTILIDTEFSDEKTSAIVELITGLNNIESVYLINANLYKITLSVAENDNKTSNELSKIDGVTIVEHILDEGVSASEHEAKIMENGLILHEHFFEKISG